MPMVHSSGRSSALGYARRPAAHPRVDAGGYRDSTNQRMEGAMTSLIPAPPSVPVSAQALAKLAVLSLESPSSRRNYSREITRFIASGRSLDREGVQAYIGQLRASGASAA